MTRVNILANFEREINKIDEPFVKPAVDDSMFWLNQAIYKFIKLRFNGDFVHHTGFEETEKRRKDLINLFKNQEYIISSENYRTPQYLRYSVEYPKDFLYVLNEEADIKSENSDHSMMTSVFECTRDSFMYRINNSLTDFHYRNHKARPIRVRNANGCDLYTDTKYEIEKYYLGYLRKPEELTLTSENAYEEYSDFSDETMYEIIKIAAQMYLENQSEERYKTLTQEVLTQE